MDTSYVPNNPQFGLQLECQWSGGATGPTSSWQGTDDLSPCWPEDMGSFSLPLDLEPLPSLFPFSPSNSNAININNNNNNFYKTEFGSQGTQSALNRDLKPPHVVGPADMADVLLSLKHAVVHPGQTSGNERCYDPSSCGQQIYHPHQMLLSPAGSCSAGPSLYDQAFATTQPMFPSMSVNVSMNMTMHGYHPTPVYPSAEVSCPQVQWNTTPQLASPVGYQTQGLLSPTYGGATYSFTADFRPPQESTIIPPYKPVPVTYASPRPHRHNLGLIDEDSQRPNVCVICAKSYARPSTLKTHMRTHSGEKPYRCSNCNKSFSQAANLTAHVRTHSGEKPFCCRVCNRRFSQSSSVTTHMRTHSGERPYQCKLCRKSFSDSSTLTKHMRIHSGEKPYECKMCLLRFSQSGNLNRHMRVHGLPGLMAA